MPADNGYRDALAAAHSRIEQLEHLAAEHRKSNALAATLVALHRERARVVGELQPRHNWARPFFFRVGAPFFIASLAFAIDGHWLFASGGIAFAIAAWFGVRALVRARASAAARQLALVDTEIAQVTSSMGMSAPAAGTSADSPMAQAV